MRVFGKKGKTADKPAGVVSSDVNKNVVSPQPVNAAEKTSTPPVSTSPDKTPQSTEPQQTSVKKTKLAPVMAIVLILIGIGLASAYYLQSKKDKTTKDVVFTEIDSVNKAFADNDKNKALEHAKKALEETPNDPNALAAVASLTQELNPEEAKQYHIRAFEVYKNERDLDTAEQTATTYWAAARLAEKAGYTDEAIKYYGLVIKNADVSDSYQKHLSNESELALERLK